jgi:transketolase
VESARRTGCMVTAEEHLASGGLGSAVSEVLSESCPTPLRRVGIRDTFGLSGKPDDLLKHFGLTPEDITRAALTVITRKRKP